MSTRNIHVNTASYTLLVAGKKKNTGEEWDVLEFSSLTELKKYRKSHPEKMAFSYSYALSRGVDTQFRHINIAETPAGCPVFCVVFHSRRGAETNAGRNPALRYSGHTAGHGEQ